MKNFKRNVSMLCVLSCIGVGQAIVYANDSQNSTSENEINKTLDKKVTTKNAGILQKTNDAGEVINIGTHSKRAMNFKDEDGTVFTVEMDADENKTYYKNGEVVTDEKEIAEINKKFDDLELSRGAARDEKVAVLNKTFAEPGFDVREDKNGETHSERVMRYRAEDGTEFRLEIDKDGNKTYYKNDVLVTDEKEIAELNDKVDTELSNNLPETDVAKKRLEVRKETDGSITYYINGEAVTDEAEIAELNAKMQNKKSRPNMPRLEKNSNGETSSIQ